MNNRLRNTSLGQQLALAAAALCLVTGLALVALGAVSSRHMQTTLQQEYGAAMAELIAARLGTALQSGDLLSVSASLQHFVASSAADQIVLTDIDGKKLGQAGAAPATGGFRYSVPVTIAADVAGQVTVTVSTARARVAQSQFVFGLLGLAVLLSLSVYGLARHWGRQLGRRLAHMARSITLEDDGAVAPSPNELQSLARRIEALPMDLLRTRAQPGVEEDNYRSTAVLYLYLHSLEGYVDTLNEQALQRYTHRLHQVVYAAAGFYGGELQVARQFGLAVYFSGDNKAGSAAFRAASCAWLVRAVCRELEQQMSLSMHIPMAIAHSELGIGHGGDIYPGLYMQSTLDELQDVCADRPSQLLLSAAACEDLDVASRLQLGAATHGEYAPIEEFAATFRDLLERQLRLIMRKLTDPLA